MVTMKSNINELEKCVNKHVIFKIQGSKQAEGIVIKEENHYYFLSNSGSYDGSHCKDSKGYKYSWILNKKKYPDHFTDNFEYLQFKQNIYELWD